VGLHDRRLAAVNLAYARAGVDRRRLARGGPTAAAEGDLEEAAAVVLGLLDGLLRLTFEPADDAAARAARPETVLPPPLTRDPT
jgi:hypothetical protein